MVPDKPLSDPFTQFNPGFSLQMPTANPDQTNGGNVDLFQAVPPATEKEQTKALEDARQTPRLVEFPRHLYIPFGATSLDLRKVCTIHPNAPGGELLMSFTAPEGSLTRFISYGIMNDGDLESQFLFLPLVNKARVFPYHGDPMANYRISLGLGPDLTNNSLIPCQLQLSPGQVLEWYVVNGSAVDAIMGVRMVGYFDTGQQITTPKFGG